jgi:hypothetical protein
VLEVSKDKTFRVLIRNPNQGLLALRILLHKFYVQRAKWDEMDLVLVTELRMYINQLENRQGLLTHSKWLASKQLLKLALTFPEIESFPYWAVAQLRILSKHLMSSRAFLGLNIGVRDFFKSSNRKLWSRPRPQRFIGVGYRDQGTARVVSIDSSPSWQEVAVKLSQNVTGFDRTEIGIISPYPLRL